MQACRYGHWEVVQTLLLFRCNVRFLSHSFLHKHDYANFQVLIWLIDLFNIKKRVSFSLLFSTYLIWVPWFNSILSNLWCAVFAAIFLYKAALEYLHWACACATVFLQVTRADYLSGRTALHFAAVNGHVRCIRLLVADFVPSAPYEVIRGQKDGYRGDGPSGKNKHEQRYWYCIAPPIYQHLLLSW